MLKHLERRARRTRKRIVLVLDNASAHTSQRSTEELKRLQGLIEVFWLPTYTSKQLNEIEWVWQHLKADYFSRMLVRRREQFVHVVVRFLEQLRSPGVIQKFLKPRKRLNLRTNLVRVA